MLRFGDSRLNNHFKAVLLEPTHLKVDTLINYSKVITFGF